MIRWLFNLFARFSPYETRWVEDLPEDTRRNTVYIVGGREHPFSAAVVCPRRECRQVVHLDLSPQVLRRWKVEEHSDGRISLSPSIHVTGLPCRCHYRLRHGRVVWSETPPFFVPEVNRHD